MPYVGDLTLAQIAKQKGITVHGAMTVAELLAALGIIMAILGMFFPAIQSLLNALAALNVIFATILALYATLEADLIAAEKLLDEATAALSPGPGSPKTLAQTAKDSQKTIVASAKAAIVQAAKAIEDKVMNTPIKDFAVGLPLPL